MNVIEADIIPSSKTVYSYYSFEVMHDLVPKYGPFSTHFCDTQQPHLCVVLSLHTSLDSQHFPECILVAVANFKLLPRLPVGLASAWITHLGAVAEYAPRSVNFTKLCL